MLEKYERYMSDVESGAVTTCLYIKQAVERQRKDLARQNTDGFKFYFDEAAAEKALKLFSLLRHTKGEWETKKRKFDLQDFQAFEIACVFGWKKQDSGYRRFTRVYSETARKSGKTEKCAGIQIIGAVEGEGGAEVYSAATTRDQASIVFQATKHMAKCLKEEGYKWAADFKILAHEIQKGTAVIKALSAEAKTLDGKNPHFVIIDEFHAHPNREVLDVMETGMGARSQPLLYIITTAGFNIDSPCYRLRETATQILSGAKTDESFFSVIYTLDEGDDWEDESAWIKANPNIGNTPKWDWMREQATKAKNEGFAKRVEFLTKNLNLWQNAKETWIADEIYQTCADADLWAAWYDVLKKAAA